jgi:hypothetical protein
VIVSWQDKYSGSGSLQPLIILHYFLAVRQQQRTRTLSSSIGMATIAAAGKKRGVPPALGWWLLVVGTVRLAFTWSCFFGSAALCSATYSQAQGALN